MVRQRSDNFVYTTVRLRTYAHFLILSTSFSVQKLNLTGMAVAESPPSTPPVVRRSMSGMQYTVYKQVQIHFFIFCIMTRYYTLYSLSVSSLAKSLQLILEISATYRLASYLRAD